MRFTRRAPVLPRCSRRTRRSPQGAAPHPHADPQLRPAGGTRRLRRLRFTSLGQIEAWRLASRRGAPAGSATSLGASASQSERQGAQRDDPVQLANGSRDDGNGGGLDRAGRSHSGRAPGAIRPRLHRAERRPASARPRRWPSGLPSFDGVPLDVDVTLPPTGNGPFPTIVMLHGWGGARPTSSRARPTATATRPTTTTTSTTRSTATRCSTTPPAVGATRAARSSSRTPDCAKGWVHLADQRYEARDTQYLLGLLADENIANRQAIGVTGISYGGGQSIELAYLKNRIRKPDGDIRAVDEPEADNRSRSAPPIHAGRGRTWSTRCCPTAASSTPSWRRPDQSRNPFGVEIQSYVSGLYARRAGERVHRARRGRLASRPHELVRRDQRRRALRRRCSGDRRPDLHLSPGLRPGGNAGADAAREWMDGRPLPARAVAAGVQRRDVARRIRRAPVRRPRTQPRVEQGQHRPGVQRPGAGFFDAKLRSRRHAAGLRKRDRLHPDLPASAPGGGPFTAASWPRCIRGPDLRLRGDRRPSTSAGGNPTIAAGFDPIGGTTDACKTVTAETDPGTAVYTMTSPGFTLMGLPDGQRAPSTRPGCSASSWRGCGMCCRTGRSG